MRLRLQLTFFDAEADTEVEKSSPSSYAGNTPPAPNNTPKSDTNNKGIKQSTDKNTQSNPNQRKNNRKRSFTKGDKSKESKSKKGAPNTPKQQDIRTAMKPGTPKRKEMATSPEGIVCNNPKSLKHDDEKG